MEVKMFKIFFSNKNKNEQASPQQKANGRRRELSTIQEGYRLANKYEVTKKLGEGGFGATFLVKDLTKSVPIIHVAKLQKLGDDEEQNKDLLQRFNQEAQTLQKLGSSHGQIPSLVDFFDFEGNFYLIQEFVQGKSLHDALIEKLEDNYVFSEKKAIEIILSLLEVLQSVHEQNIIHRDIKPQNIILRKGDEKPVLIDFGIIKDAAVSNLGETGTVIGTPGYCPVEQAVGKTLFQSDLYAVGMTLLVLITGVPPHRIPISEDFKIDLSFLEDSISEHLFNWLKNAIAVLPQNRFESAARMRETLLNIYNLEYIAKGIEIAQVMHEDEMEKMKAEIQSLKQQLKQTNNQGKEALIENLQETPSEINIPEKALQIVTTQLELKAFYAIKRMFERSGLDQGRLQMKDSLEYCGINIDGDENKTLIRLYFNDEENLSFAIILADGKEEKFNINTMRGIAPKTDQIIARAQELINQKSTSSSEDKNQSKSHNKKDSNIDDVLSNLETQFKQKK
jgi:serine/threonine-protein kinase